MTKIEKLKDELEKTYITHDGEIIDGDVIINKALGCRREVNEKIRRGYLKERKVLEEGRSYYEVSNNKKFNGRRWVMLYQLSLRHTNISLKAEGLFTRFIEYLRQDGSGNLCGDTTKKHWQTKSGLSKNAFDKLIKELEDLRLIHFIRNKGFFLNPYYVRFGNRIDKTLVDMFDNIVFNGEDIVLSA